MKSSKIRTLQRSPPYFFTGVILVFIFVFLLSLSLGSVMINPFSFFKEFHHQNSLTQEILFRIRLPRVVGAFAVGGLLSLAGALLQVLLRNPLADPYIMGLSGGASFFFLCGLLLGLSGFYLNTIAFVGSLFSMGVIFLLMHSRLLQSRERLTLVGVLLASGWVALLSFMLSISSASLMSNVLFWFMGDLSHVGSPFCVCAVLLIAIIFSTPLGHRLNILACGDLEAQALGVQVKTLQILLFVMSSLLTALAVATAGNIGFVGLIIPHAVRLLGVTHYKRLLPASAILGGVFLMLADTLSRIILPSQQLPVGVMTALLGVPLCVYLCLRRGLV